MKCTASYIISALWPSMGKPCLITDFGKGSYLRTKIWFQDEVSQLEDIECANYKAATCPEKELKVEISKGHYVVIGHKPG